MKERCDSVNPEALDRTFRGRDAMRVLMVGLMFYSFAFLAGVAGDLSLAAPPGPSSDPARAAIPPDAAIAPGAMHAHPLAPLAASDSHRAHRHARLRTSRKPHTQSRKPD